MPAAGPSAVALLYRMAEALEIDLAEALLDGRLDGSTLRASRARCETCAAVADCGAWLTANGADGPVPGFCPNAPVLGGLLG